MGRFANEHPQAVKTAVGNAIADGMKVPEVVRRLAQGSLKGYEGAYELPTETARYYGKREKDRRAALAISPLAKGDPSKGIDHLARQLFTEAETGIAEMRRSKARDPEALKKWGDALRVIGSLLRPEEAQPTKTRRRDKPSDPLTAALATAASDPVPDSPSREKTGSGDGAENGADDTTTEPVAAAGLLREPGSSRLVRAPDHWPVN